MLRVTMMLAATVFAQVSAPKPPVTPVVRPVPATAPRPAPDKAVIPRCIVTIINEIQLPARVPGQLMELKKIEGQSVKAGEVIGKLDDRDVVLKKMVTEVERAISDMQSKNAVKVLAAKAGEELAKSEYDQGLALEKKNSIAPSELRRLKFAYEKAKLEAEAAAVEQTIQVKVVKARDAQIASADDEILRRQIVSPINGVVEKVSKRVGEWLSPGEVVLTLIELEQVRVEGFLNSNEFAAHEVLGKEVLVEVEMARGRIESFPATIGYASAKDDAAGEYRVWAVIKNRQENGQWLVRAGQRARMTVNLKSSPQQP